MSETKKRLLGFGAIALLVASASNILAQEAAKEKTRYVLKDTPFEVLFPGKPKEIDIQGGKQGLFTTKDGNETCLVHTNKFAASLDLANDKEIVQKVLDSARKKGIELLEGKLVFEKAFMHSDKYPARQVKIEAPDGLVIRSYFIVTPTHFCQVAVGGRSKFTESAAAKEFLDSLKIKK